MNEKLSAFLDNELSEIEERRLLNELAADKEQRAAWERYHLIRASLRGELEAVAPASLSGRISDAIAQQEVPRRDRRARVTWRKAAGGFAIAASVATVALLSLQGPTLQTANNETPTAPVVDVAKVAGPDKTGQLPTNPLNAYLVEHNEFAPTAGVSGLLPYVRTVNDSGR
jgi:sigma-E factor negative regulatory protein RseA